MINCDTANGFIINLILIRIQHAHAHGCMIYISELTEDRVDTKVSLVTDIFYFEFDGTAAALEHGLNVFLCGALSRTKLLLS